MNDYEKLDEIVVESVSDELMNEQNCDLKIGHVNVNGWAKNNNELPTEIINQLNCDVIGISETHLTGDKSLCIPGYCWVGKNRAISVKMRRSGGVGFLISCELLSNYEMETIVINNECATRIKLVNKDTGFKMAVFVVYILPENSVFYNNCEELYDELLLQLYVNVNYDSVVFVGDLNARTGDLKDHCNFDKLPQRVNVDTAVNNHGRDLINFLLEGKCCILNGRLGCSDFTVDKNTGRSVVDYCLARHGDLNMFKQFEVINCVDLIIDGAKIDECSRVPDHNELKITMNVSAYVVLQRDKMLGVENIKRKKL